MSLSQAVVATLRESLAHELSRVYSHLPTQVQDRLVSKIVLGVQPNLEEELEAAGEEANAEAPFRFLDLHPELRNRIYEFALEDHDDNTRYVVHHTSRGPLKSSKDKQIRSLAKGTSLLRVCRQIRREASGYFYAGNTFVASSGSAARGWNWDDALSKAVLRVQGWLELIGEKQAGQVKCMVLRTSLGQGFLAEALRPYDYSVLRADYGEPPLRNDRIAKLLGFVKLG